MTNQAEEIQDEIDFLEKEILEMENKLVDLGQDFKKNELLMLFYEEVLNRKTMRYLDLKIKLERMKANV
jgi:hypothetical protein